MLRDSFKALFTRTLIAAALLCGQSSVVLGTMACQDESWRARVFVHEVDRGSEVLRCDWGRIQVTNARLEDLSVISTQANGISFFESTLTGWSLTLSSFVDSTFENTRINRSQFRQSQFSGSSWIDVRSEHLFLKDVQIRNSRWIRSYFGSLISEDASWRGVDFSQVNLEAAYFLRGAWIDSRLRGFRAAHSRWRDLSLERLQADDWQIPSSLWSQTVWDRVHAARSN